ncbi:MAG: hypothetical protein EA382_04985 [Spirochaetaceae bacterium]|nr:MAG: hypothetical protein EA382_04985 [Spirochaetaceae bacterium]
MGSAGEPIYVFHVYRKDGVSLFLHPFRKIERVHALLTKHPVVGHYGREPRVESLTLFRNELYRIVEQEVKVWVADARFIPRFLLSSAVFLVAFLFLSIVVRDPIPVIDELVISLAASIAVYILLGRKYMRSDEALKRRIDLRTRVDQIVFTESPFIKSIEELLIECEDETVESTVERLVKTGESLGIDGYDPELQQMTDYLDSMLSGDEYKQTRKRLRRAQRDKSTRSRDGLQRSLESKKIDVPLLSLYNRLTQKAERGS